MVIDLHTHMMLSKTFEFNEARVGRYVRMASLLGLRAIALTEHLHAYDYFEVHKYMAKKFNLEGGIYNVSDKFAFIPGVEISVVEGGDILAIGPYDHIKIIAKRLNMPPLTGYKPRFEELLNAKDGLDLIFIGAHMFRAEKSLEKFSPSLLKKLDAVEANGKDYGLEYRLVRKANDLDLAVTGGSDAHHWLQLGVRATLVPDCRLNLESLQRAILEQKTTYWCGKYPAVKVYFSKRIKRTVKALKKPKNQGYGTLISSFGEV